MAVNAAIDHKTRGDDRRILAGLGEELGLQRYFKTARDFEILDVVPWNAQTLGFLGKGISALIHDLLMPASLDKRYPSAHMREALGFFIFWNLALIHGGAFKVRDHEQGVREKI